jgi:hypothetical protein
LAEGVRVVLVERGKVLLDPATQVIVVERGIDNRESKAAPMTRIIAVDIEDLTIGPLLWELDLRNSFERPLAILAAIARPGSDSSPE